MKDCSVVKTEPMREFLQGFIASTVLLDFNKTVSVLEANMKDVDDCLEGVREKMKLDMTYNGRGELNELRILRDYYYAMSKLFQFVFGLPEKKED
jgi:hypothetical protein